MGLRACHTPVHSQAKTWPVHPALNFLCLPAGQASLYLYLSTTYTPADTPQTKLPVLLPYEVFFCRFAGRPCLTNTVACNNFLCCLAAFCKPQRTALPAGRASRLIHS